MYHNAAVPKNKNPLVGYMYVLENKIQFVSLVK